MKMPIHCEKPALDVPTRVGKSNEFFKQHIVIGRTVSCNNLTASFSNLKLQTLHFSFKSSQCSVRQTGLKEIFSSRFFQRSLVDQPAHRPAVRHHLPHRQRRRFRLVHVPVAGPPGHRAPAQLDGVVAGRDVFADQWRRLSRSRGEVSGNVFFDHLLGRTSPGGVI